MLGSSVRTYVVPRHSAGVVRTYVRGIVFSSTNAMPRLIRRPTPTIIAHSMNKTLEDRRQEGKPRRDSSIAIDRQPVPLQQGLTFQLGSKQRD